MNDENKGCDNCKHEKADFDFCIDCHGDNFKWEEKARASQMETKDRIQIRLEIEEVITKIYPELDEGEAYGELLEMIDDWMDDISHDVLVLINRRNPQ